MKIDIISDLHLDWVTSGISRFIEGKRALDQTVDDAIKRKVDLFVFCGDLCNPDSGSNILRCVSAAVTAAAALAAAGIQSIWLKGNHDVIEDGSGESTLEPIRALSEFSSPGMIHVVSEPLNKIFRFKNKPYQIICLPFVATDGEYNADELVSGLPQGGELNNSIPLLVFSHLHLRGIMPGEETQEMPRGRDIWFPDERLHKIASKRPLALMFSGHYHRRQIHKTPSGLDVQVIGAPLRFTHGEEHHQPAFLRVDTGERFG